MKCDCVSQSTIVRNTFPEGSLPWKIIQLSFRTWAERGGRGRGETKNETESGKEPVCVGGGGGHPRASPHRKSFPHFVHLSFFFRLYSPFRFLSLPPPLSSFLVLCPFPDLIPLSPSLISSHLSSSFSLPLFSLHAISTFLITRSIPLSLSPCLSHFSVRRSLLALSRSASLFRFLPDFVSFPSHSHFIPWAMPPCPFFACVCDS